jgi:hypothetical protein
MTKEYNEYEDYTIQELRDLRDKLEDRLDVLNAQPINYYSAGYHDTYLAAMSQTWGIDVCKNEIASVNAEIQKRNEEELYEMVEETTGN